MWLCSNDDLKSMYTKYPKGEITLWCEGKCAEQSNVCGKRKRDEPKSSKRQDKEDEVEAVYKELKGKHGESSKPASVGPDDSIQITRGHGYSSKRPCLQLNTKKAETERIICECSEWSSCCLC